MTFGFCLISLFLQRLLNVRPGSPNGLYCWCEMFHITDALPVTQPVVSKHSLSLSLSSRWTWVSRCLLKQRMIEAVVTTGAINRAKLQSNHHHQQTNTQFFTGRMPFLLPNHNVKALNGKISHSKELLTPSSPGVFQMCLWPLIAPDYLGGGLPCLSSALWCQYSSIKALKEEKKRDRCLRLFPILWITAVIATPSWTF